MTILSRHARRRGNEFFKVILEQDDGGDAPAGDAPQFREKILSTPDASDSMSETNASMDEIVDKYLLQYEKEAVPVNNSNGGGSGPGKEGTAQGEPPQPVQEQTVRSRKRRSSSLSSFLFEQDDPGLGGGAAPAPSSPGGGGDPFGGGGDAGGGDDPFGGDDGGGDDGGDAPDKPSPAAPVPHINVRRFAEGVARLANNYQALIDPQTVILNRAMYYVSKNYSARLAKELMSILQRDFNLTPKTTAQKSGEAPPAPRAGGSGPDNGGGAPGGGGGSSSSGV